MNNFPKRPSGALLHTLSKLYDVPLGFVPLSIEVMYCFICGHRSVAAFQYRMICLLFMLKYVYLVKFKCFGKDKINEWEANQTNRMGIVITQFSAFQRDFKQTSFFSRAGNNHYDNT